MVLRASGVKRFRRHERLAALRRVALRDRRERRGLHDPFSMRLRYAAGVDRG
jgi:hypothetical protein